MGLILGILAALVISFFIGKKAFGAVLVFFGFAAMTSVPPVGLVMMAVGALVFLSGLKK
ncbi:hypothetical protein ACTXGK_03425 [Psychrobacter sp. T6-5]|uniref:hypothetical protein n=1 Tax=Psychrobacter sp. T6-5 TaxID=3457451 RepID=UPI003FCF8605